MNRKTHIYAYETMTPEFIVTVCGIKIPPDEPVDDRIHAGTCPDCLVKAIRHVARCGARHFVASPKYYYWAPYYCSVKPEPPGPEVPPRQRIDLLRFRLTQLSQRVSEITTMILALEKEEEE